MFYRVRAINPCNDGDSNDTGVCGDGDAGVSGADRKWSDVVEATADPIAPIVEPQALIATGGNRRVTLTWNAVAEENNGGAEITSQELQRWNSSTRQWDPIKDDIEGDTSLTTLMLPTLTPAWSPGRPTTIASAP